MKTHVFKAEKLNEKFKHEDIERPKRVIPLYKTGNHPEALVKILTRKPDEADEKKIQAESKKMPERDLNIFLEFSLK
ncbi:MAG: hypothetical protein HQM10_02780 [Candidatus Riflebacteria bacterium]|nr:hypothetical protein [Candidatus Riflebacteria bacterium]